MNACPHPMHRTTPLAALFAIVLVAASPVHAQYKVVGPDNKVTYTDRPPADSAAKVTAIGSRTGGVATDAALPLELRQPVARYPVLLYVATGSCEPCDSARQLLRQRGVPYSEKQVLSQEDGEALERLTGGRDAPTLTIGSQTLRGLAPEVWNSYLDAAGYPRESRLPANYQYAAATPLTERKDTTPAPTRPRAGTQRADADAAPPVAPSPSASGIKF